MKYQKAKCCLSLFLAMVMLVLCFCTPVFADDEESSEIIDIQEEISLEELPVDGTDRDFSDVSDIETVVTPEEEPEEIIEEEPEYLNTVAYQFFKAAGFLMPEMDEIMPNSPMSRAQFVSIAAKLSNLEGNAGVLGAQYWDVPSNSPYAPYIYGMRDLGHISGVTAEEFRPDAPVTWGQILKITMRILGYETLALRHYGTYPQAYMIQAGKLNLVPAGITADGTVSNREVFDFLLEAVQVDMMIPAVGKDGKDGYERREDVNLLSEYHSIYEDKGIVSYNGETGLTEAANSAGRSKVIIGGRTLWRENDTDIRGLLGMWVQYFYSVEPGNDATLIYAGVREHDNEILIIDAEDLVREDPEFSVTEIVYYDEDEDREEAKISKLARFIYNGKAVDEFSGEDYKIEAGTLKLISHSNSGEYDVVVAEEFENCFVSTVDVNKNRLHNTYGGVIDFADYETVEIYDVNGRAITIEDIDENDVVSYFADADGKGIVLYVISEKISGTVGVSDVGILKDNTYIIKDIEYKLAANVRAAIENNLVNASKPLAGLTYDFYLDKGGRVGGVNMIEADLQYAVFCRVDQPGGLAYADKIRLEMVLSNGEVTVAPTADKFTVNGTAATASALKTMLEGYSPYPLIRVAFNTKGEIRKLELAADITSEDDFTEYGYNDEKFSLDYYNVNCKYRGSNHYVFQGVYKQTPETVIFRLPYEEDGSAFDADEIKVVHPNNLPHNQNYKVALYDADATLTARAVVIQSRSRNYQNTIFVVDEVTKALNDDGEEVLRVKGFEQGKYKTIDEAEDGILVAAKIALTDARTDLTHIDTSCVKPGDVFRTEVVDGKVVAAIFLNSVSGDLERYIAVVQTPSSDQIYDKQVTVVGPVYAMSDYAISIINPDVTKDIKGKISTHTLYNTVVTVFDTEKNRVTLGSLADVDIKNIPAKDGTVTIDENSQWVLLYRSSDIVYEMVVVK